MKKLQLMNRFSSLVATAVFLFSFGVSITPASAATTNNSKLAACSVKHKNPSTITRSQTIGFSVTTQNDSTLPAGQTKIIQVGHNGTRVLTYKASYKKGKLTACKHTDTKVTIAAVNTIQSNGTYVAPAPTPSPAPTPAPSCTNGSYVNTAGNTVCSPESTPSQPAGATAQCVDGTYSFSQSRSGTCSHHGGVATWL